MISLLDYGAGNVRSLRNAIQALGFSLTEIERPEDILKAERLIFPGVGSFGAAMQRLHAQGYVEPLKQYLAEGRPFFGICIGLQTLFEGSEESPGIPGLGLIPGQIRRFDPQGGGSPGRRQEPVGDDPQGGGSPGRRQEPVGDDPQGSGSPGRRQEPGRGDAGQLSVPHMGWNGVHLLRPSPLFADYAGEKLYFVHSYRAVPGPENAGWVLATTDYGEPFVSAVSRGRVAAVQFHPEKSGAAGLKLLRHFLAGEDPGAVSVEVPSQEPGPTRLAKRIIACLDVRTNDAGDLVVTKGDQYDVREAGAVRNLGKPVELARRYYDEGADEVTFLNITAFRDFPLADQPMLEVLRRTSENCFVPLTIGGGIRAFTDAAGRSYSALDVAAEYFRSGADKVSIGSDAVEAVEQYLGRGHKDGSTAIEQIARVYGNQAVVISIDPRRVYVNDPEETRHHCLKSPEPGPNGEGWCWYQCTVKGGREGRDIDAVELARACEDLGAGEILLNSIDRDGTGLGFDLGLIRSVADAVTIPVIASSGAGRVEHFSEVFDATGVEAALAAGIFHREEVPIAAVKAHLREHGVEIRG